MAEENLENVNLTETDLPGDTPIQEQKVEDTKENSVETPEQTEKPTEKKEETPIDEQKGDKEEIKEKEKEQPQKEEKTKEEVVTEEELNPEDLDFEDAKYHVEGYDLKKYADALNFDDDDSIKIIRGEIKKLKEKGYSQREAEIYIDAKLEVANEYEDKPRTKEELLKTLNESLTKEEKSNYKILNSILKETAKASGLTPEQTKEAMFNPNIVKMLNGVYKHLTKTGAVVNPKEVPKPNIELSYDNAVSSLHTKIKEKPSKEDLKKYAEDLLSKVEDKEKDRFKIIIKNII